MKVTMYYQLHNLNNPNQYLQYKQYNHCDIQNILKDWYYFHNTHLYKNKLQEMKVTMYYQLHNLNNPNQYLQYKQYNHCGIQNILKDWYYLQNTPLYKNKLQEKIATQYLVLHSSSNPNYSLYYKQYNHCGIQNILKDQYYFHKTHLHKNKLQEKRVTQYLLQHTLNNLYQYLQYKQYNHCGIQNILKDWYYQHITHLHKNKLQEKKVTLYNQLHSSNNPNYYLHYK